MLEHKGKVRHEIALTTSANGAKLTMQFGGAAGIRTRRGASQVSRSTPVPAPLLERTTVRATPSKFADGRFCVLG